MNVSDSMAANQNWGSTDLPAMGMMAAQGGEVPIVVSKGERILSPDKAKAVAVGKADPIKDAKKVPGKPKYPGNDYRNDVVPAKEPPGAIVIPNEILQGPDREKRAISFVQSALAKHRK